jgi:hypothetical protein
MATVEPSREVRGGKPNVQKLLKPTKHHPKGRIKMENGEIVGTKNNILYYNEKVIKQDIGGMKVEIARVQIPVNGGHVKLEGSVWRVGLYGPEKYHKKVLLDKANFERKGSTKDRCAPELEQEEFDEYKKYLQFLKETEQEIAPNEAFYKWLKKAK